MRLCSTPDCGKKHRARGLCEGCYRRATDMGIRDSLPRSDIYRKPRMSRDELLAWVFAQCRVTEGGCWEWGRARFPAGYGKMCVGPRKGILVTRFVLGLESGDSREAIHSCDNPPCCNPAHLRAGTHADNMRDMAERGRGRTAPPRISRRLQSCRRGHPLADGAAGVWVDSGGKARRYCRECVTIRSRERRAAQKKEAA